MNRLLIVEDDELLGSTIRLNLESQGYEVRWLKDGLEASQVLESSSYDLVLLDISLPGLDGISLLRQLRKAEINCPVLMLTVRSEIQTKVEAFEIGADDYLTKPFDVDELLARVAALLRRAQAERHIPSSHVIRIGQFEVNLETRQAETNLGSVVLSAREAELLGLLARAGGQPLSRNDILDEVWGMDAFPTERTVDNFLLRLRKLFEQDPKHPEHILTVRGVGYRLVL